MTDPIDTGLETGPDATGKVRLHWSARKGSLNTLRRWICAGLPLDPLDHHQDTPLHYAVWNGQFEFARVLLENGANPALPNHKGRTAFHHAAAMRDLPTLDAFLAHKCSWSTRDADGRTPLSMLMGRAPPGLRNPGLWTSQVAQWVVEHVPPGALDKGKKARGFWKELATAHGEEMAEELDRRWQARRLALAVPLATLPARPRSRM